MDAAIKRRVGVIVVATVAVTTGGLVWFALRDDGHPHIEPLFEAGADEWPAWPPEANADLEAELATTAAARRIGAAGMLSDYDAGPHEGDIPGLMVRTGYAEDLYYIEAVIGEDAHFEDPMPMAVLIHGRGDRARIPGGPFWGLGGPIRVIVPQAPDPLGNGFEWLPVRVGQNLVDRLTTSLLSRAAQLATMLRDLSQSLPTVGRVMVVGFSQGGLLTFTLATHHSDVVQAAFPLSAWLPPALVPPYRRDDLVYPRIRGMHGSADAIIEPTPTVELYETLRERGFDAELEIFDGVGHEMTEAMNDQLHVWLAEEMGLVIEEGIRAGVLDGGVEPCVPIGEWPTTRIPDGGWPEGGPPEAGWPLVVWPEAGWPEGGWPDGGVDVPAWIPCPELEDAGVALDEAGVNLDAGVPDAAL
ncbi:MAG: dienelactone hydrolase family protein [Sandaracinaceae bacterium]|nr:dienelactone hydrolase family protein [Sandaracinaceae bacterium]